MSATPLFSVVIPCYNYGRFLPETVASLDGPTNGDAGESGGFGGLEVIIVDDGSTDETPQVAQELVSRHPHLNVTLIRQENKGPAAARNAGISRARGEWIMAVDSDDLLAEGFLRQAAAAIKEHPEANALTGAYREFGMTESEWKLTRFNPERLKEHGNILSCSPYKKRLWELTGGYDPSNPWGAEDWHFWLKCLAHGLNMLCLPVPMYYYRQHEGGRIKARQNFTADFKAMSRCHEPGLYARQDVLAAHQALLGMAPESAEATKRTIERHPDLPLPHFLFGLFFEGRNKKAQAKTCYETALALAAKNGWPGAWQIELRLSGL